MMRTIKTCLLIPVFCLLASGCGFRPLHQDANTFADGGGTTLDDVYITTIGEASGLFLRNALIDRFYHHGAPDNPRYVLTIALVEFQRSLAIRKNDTATRAQWVIRASYKLSDRATRRALDAGDIRAIASYNILSSQYTTLATQDEAREAALREIADKITLRTSVVLDKE